MRIRWAAAPIVLLILPALLVACASSKVEEYAAADAETIITDVVVRPSESDPDLFTFKGPAIDVRAGFGAFATGILRGGSNLGSSIALQGTQIGADQVAHRIVATMQYTNLGGTYRVYDTAGIEGVDGLTVEPINKHKQFTPNGVIMTETIAVNTSDALLRSRQNTDLVLRVGAGSGKFETLQIPQNYVVAYLLAVDRQMKAVASQ